MSDVQLQENRAVLAPYGNQHLRYRAEKTFIRAKPYTQQLIHFFADAPIEFIGMDILEPLPKIKQDDQFVVVMTDRYTQLTKSSLPLKIDTTIARTVLENFGEILGFC